MGRYRHDSGGRLEMCWPDAFNDLLDLAHPHSQLDPDGTFVRAEAVLVKHGWDISEPGKLREFLAVFDGPQKKRRSRYIPKAVRARVLTPGVCAACGTSGPLHVDHKRPFSRGGSSHPSNLQALCGPCNINKGARSMSEWSR
jgi:hypothetical protein